jgi:hypothetical protein
LFIATPNALKTPNPVGMTCPRCRPGNSRLVSACPTQGFPMSRTLSKAVPPV